MQLSRTAAKEMRENNDNSEKDKELPTVRTFKQDVPTRWNSTFIILKYVFDAHDSIKIVINGNPVVEDLINLLLPFFQFTEVMSGS